MVLERINDKLEKKVKEKAERYNLLPSTVRNIAIAFGLDDIEKILSKGVTRDELEKKVEEKYGIISKTAFVRRKKKFYEEIK